MEKFQVWLERTHPEFEIQEWPQWMNNVGKGLKNAAIGATVGASLLGPGAGMLRDPTPVDQSVSASYYHATDDVAHRGDQEDLERIKAGKNPLDRGGGEDTQIASQDEIEGDQVGRGSQNWLAASGKKAGTRAIWEKGFGGPKDKVVGRGWHTFGFDDRDQVRQQQIGSALGQVRSRAAQGNTNIPFDKLTHHDTKDVRVGE